MKLFRLLIHLAFILPVSYTHLYTKPEDNVDYMNGIAYDQENNRIFVTGKYWPRLFEVRWVESK